MRTSNSARRYGALSFAIIAALAFVACTRDEARPVADKSAPAAQPTAAPATPAMHYFDNLGSYGRKITTNNADAQRWFDQGLRLMYGFNHQAAQRSFEEAAKADPDCAMCYWGQSIALGPNINLPMAAEANEPAYALAQKALSLVANTSPSERALIEALAVRYAKEPPADRKPLDEAYANAMRDVVAKHPNDLDAATLFAEALMDLSPWAYWERDGKPASERTPELISHLERVLAANPGHIGAVHYYIHATEASPNPEKAEPYADQLALLSPGSGHLVHMPAHTYIRVGRYHDATLNNLKATEADQHFLAFCRGTNGVYPLGYVPHNWHFIAMTAALEGNAERSLHAAAQTAKRADATMFDALPFMQQFVAAPLYAQVRFGHWDDILALTAAPADRPFTQGMWHYARARAYTAKADYAAAEREINALAKIAADPALKDVRFFDVNSASEVLAVAVPSARGELAAARGDRRAARAELEKSIKAQDAHKYQEPADWPLSQRTALAAVLLAEGDAKGAEKLYREDLVAFPKNGWALHGLERALLAQKRDAEAAETRAAFDAAWQYADYKLAAK
jgi:hypothetical protein